MLGQIGRFFGIVWRTGNFWGRIFILLIVCWPLFLALIATIGAGTAITSLLALIPFFAIVAGIAAYPVISAALVYFNKSRNILGWIAAIIGTELVIGAYFSALPLSNDRGLVPLLILVIAALVLLSLAKKLAFVRSILWIALIILTAIFIFGGREEVKKMGARKGEGVTFTTKGEMEDGYWVVPEKLSIKPRVETSDVKQDLRDDTDIRITTNCREPVVIATLATGQNIQIRHIDFGGWEWKNRCSYNAAGSAIPIYGERYKVTRPRFRHDLPFPEMPAGAVGFSLEDEDGKIVSSDYIKNQGGIIYFNNTSGKTVKAMLRYNYMKAFTENPVTAQQIGWDGSTATFVATRF